MSFALCTLAFECAGKQAKKCLPTKKKDGICLINQKMLADDNTIYTIRYDFILEEDIVLKAGCTLRFKGGSICNKAGNRFTITGNNTKISGEKKHIFDKVRFRGTWDIDRVTSDMLKDLSSVNSLIELCNLCSNNRNNTIELGPGKYYIDVKQTEPIQSGLLIKSNTEVLLNGDIFLVNSDYNYYGIIDLLNVHNVFIHGIGSITGDLDSSKATGGGGHAIRIRQSSDIKIDGLTLRKCIGDGIYVDAYENISISNCQVDHCRRQGISITNAQNSIIDNCDISHIYGDTKASWAIDIEPNTNNKCDSIIIKNCRIHDTNKGVCCTYSTGGNARVKNVYIENNDVRCTHKAMFVDGGLGPIYVRNNFIKGYDRIEYPNKVEELSYWCIENKGKSFFINNTIEGGIQNSFEATYEGNTITSHYNSLQNVNCRKNVFNMTSGKRDNDLIQLSGVFSDNVINVLKSSYRVGMIFDVRGQSVIRDNTIYDSSIDVTLFGNVYGIARESVKGLSEIYNNSHSDSFSGSIERDYKKLRHL